MIKGKVKTQLKMEQLTAGTLLYGFDRLSYLDMTLLQEDFQKQNPDIEMTGVLVKDYLSQYVSLDAKGIILKEGLSLDTYIKENDSDLKSRLSAVAGSLVREYFDTFDIDNFLLRKIKFLGRIKEDSIDTFFCKMEQARLVALIEEGYLVSIWQEAAIYDNYKEIKLSNYGNLRLFKLDYGKEIEAFTEILRAMRYDASLLDDFLLTQDLSSPVFDILSVDKLVEFGNYYDRAITENGVSELNFVRLNTLENGKFDKEAKRCIENILSVWDDGHRIHICHPNHLFAGVKPITRDVSKMVNINWDDIDVSKMLRINDYKTFILPDCQMAFRYVHKRLGNQVMQEVKKGNKDSAVSYLVVVEEYNSHDTAYYLVRGIIRGDYQGYSVAFNPQFKNTLPKSLWERSLRFGDVSVPRRVLHKKIKHESDIKKPE